MSARIVKAIRISRHGGPEVLETVDLGEPAVGPGMARVRVTHVGMNHLDVWVRRGVDSKKFPLPIVPGSDVAGVREDTGERVVLHPGVGCMACARCLEGRHDLCRRYRVRGEGMDGGCCEVVSVPTVELLPCPMDPAQAAALPLSLLTAWHMLAGRACVGPGDSVVVQAGAGGVGSLAIQVARALGARVAATASTPEKRALCQSVGAEEAWDHGDAVARAKDWTGRRGVDCVVEHAGGATWDASLAMVRWGGTVVTCGATADHQVGLDLRVLFFKQLSLLGSTMGSMGEMCAAWEQVNQGRIRAVVDRVLPMSRIAEAHRLIEGREVRGKIVLAMDL